MFFQASDPDKLDDGNLHFEMVSEDGVLRDIHDAYFVLDANTGDIYLNQLNININDSIGEHTLVVKVIFLMK